MKIKTLLFLFSVALLSLANFSLDAKVIKDDLGNEIRISEIPKRVVTLAPNLTEMLFALGEGDKIIANTTYCNYPPEAKNKTKVGDLFSVNYEKLIGLSPDLIFMTVEGNSKGTYERLLKLGFKIFVSNPRNYEGIKKTFRDFALIFNDSAHADSIVVSWDARVEKIRKERKSKNKLKAMFVVSLSPLMLAGKNTFVNEYLKFCNLKNVADASPLNYPVFGREEILKDNPDVIILPEGKIKDTSSLLKLFPEWKNLNAIKTGSVYEINPDLFFRPGPRFVKALEFLCKKLSGK